MRPATAWKVEDGALALTAGGAGDIMTAEEFGPFELSLEWKISPNGNSGIIYLINEDPAAENTYNTGPEMQVLDNDGHADGKFPTHRAGALYDFAGSARWRGETGWRMERPRSCASPAARSNTG